MKQQKINKPDTVSRPVVIDNQRPPANTAVVTVVYVEVGGMSHEQYKELAAQFAAQYQGSVYGNFYLIPVRDGKLSTDIQLATEFLEVVNQVCEIIDNQIVLRADATNTRIKRVYVDERNDSDGD